MGAKCSDPVLCLNNGKTKIYRNYSLASPIHRELAQTVFDCNKCIACKQKYARQLGMRCVLHASLYQQNCFLTLTYDETTQGYHNQLNYRDVQLFKKRLRKHCGKKKIQIFNVHEYGKNGKKHWHLVVFNHDFSKDRQRFGQYFTSKALSKLWPHGHHTIGDVTLASAMYQAQYTQKDIKNGNLQDDKKAKSNHSGIGRDYFLQHYRQILRLGYVPFEGHKLPIPRYFLKIAHKHYAHFHDRSYFYPSPKRKLMYKFLCCTAKKDMADLLKSFLLEREARIAELSDEWRETITDYIYSKDLPDFAKAGENRKHDLAKRFNDNHF